MIAKYEDELICDLAETYHIFNYRELPVDLLATLVTGLRQNSRVKMAINGTKVPTDTLIMALIYDKLSQWVWMHTKDGRKGMNPPSSLAKMLSEEKKEKTVRSFDSGEEFDAMRKRIIEGS